LSLSEKRPFAVTRLNQKVESCSKAGNHLKSDNSFLNFKSSLKIKHTHAALIFVLQGFMLFACHVHADFFSPRAR